MLSEHVKKYMPQEPFDLREITPEALIPFWWGVGHVARCDGLLVVHKIIPGKLKDPFSHSLFQHLLEYKDLEKLHKISNNLKKKELLNEGLRLEVIRLTLISLMKEPKELIEKYNHLFKGNVIENTQSFEPPASPWFSREDNIKQWLKAGLYLVNSVHRDGFIGIFKLLDLRENVENHLFKHSLGHVVDGVEEKDLDKMVTVQNKILLQQLSIKMEMFIHGFFGLIEGRNPRSLATELGYYIPGIWEHDLS
jgi:hypothetical protein